MTRSIGLATGLMMALLSTLARADLIQNERFAPPGQAYQVLAEQRGGNWSLKLSVLPDYYVYVDKLAAYTAADGVETTLSLAESDWIDYPDPLFGTVKIYENDHQLAITESPNAGELWVRIQGCSKKGLCYPPENRLLAIIVD